MLTFSSNSQNLVARVLFFLLTLILIYLFINFGLKEPNNKHVIFKIPLLHFEFKVFYVLYFIIATVLFLAVTIVVSLLSIKKVEVNTFQDSITFTSLLKKETIAINNIADYFETNKGNGYKVFYGLLLRLKDARTIQLAGQNINCLTDLKQYLDEKNITCLGQRKMKFPFR